MSAPTTWRVIGVTSDADGVTRVLFVGGFAATCGHHHETRADAEACAWEPAIEPGAIYAGLVRQVRDERADARMRREQGRLFDDTARAA